MNNQGEYTSVEATEENARIRDRSSDVAAAASSQKGSVLRDDVKK
jgi:hypothetical protein